MKCLIALLFILTQRCYLITCESAGLSQKNNDYYQFIDREFGGLPKCCPLKMALRVNNTTLNCTPEQIKFQHFEIFTLNIAINDTNFYDSCDGIECVDFLNDTDWKLVRISNCEIKSTYKQFTNFPKCCPFDYVYNSQEHKCVQQINPVYAFNASLQVINVSLSHCPSNNFAIVDFDDDEFRINSDNSVTVGNGRRVNHGSYCIDRNARTGKEMIRACLEYEDACEKMKKRCVRKCCPDGEIYLQVDGKWACSAYYGADFNLTATGRFNYSDTDYAIITNCNDDSRYLSNEENSFYINENGYLHILFTLVKRKWVEFSPREAIYCAEHFNNTAVAPSIVLYFWLTLEQKIDSYKYDVQSIILALSCIFLFITIICYTCLPEMHNVHGKIILAFCIFMFVGDLMLCMAQFRNSTVTLNKVCSTVGFSILFAMLGAFAWMNVVCFDMWIALGTLRALNHENKRKGQRKFLWYSLYGCGIPILIGGFALIVYHTNLLPEAYVPHMGTKKCYFDKLDNTYDYLLYFIIPESIMILINVILFIKTAIYCYNVKNDIHKMRSKCSDGKEPKQQRFENDKEKFLMLVKLFLVMGIPWTFEALSSILDFKQSLPLAIIEFILDCFNTAQGIIIFCIFILKKKTLSSMKARLSSVSALFESESNNTVMTNDSSGSGK